MPVPVTVFTSTDAGAPQIVNAKPSEVFDVLMKCLVDGYGTTNPLGWSLADRDDVKHRIAFRNDVTSGGSGGYIVFRSRDETNNANTGLLFQTVLDLVSLDSIDGLGYVDAMRIPTSSTWWQLIGTAHGFVFRVGLANSKMGGWNSTNEGAIYVGDYASLVSNDVGRFVSFCQVSVSDKKIDGMPANPSGIKSTFANIPYLGTSEYDSLNIRDADGGMGYMNYALKPILASYSSSGFESVSTIPTDDAYTPILIKMRGVSPTSSTRDRNGVLVKESAISPIIRGIIPGVVIRYFGRQGDVDFPHPDLTINGQRHILLRCSLAGCAVLINAVEW